MRSNLNSLSSSFSKVEVLGRHAKALTVVASLLNLKLAKQPRLQIGREVPRTDIIHEEGAEPFIPRANDYSKASTSEPMYQLRLPDQS